MKTMLLAGVILFMLASAGAAGACGMEDSWKRPVPGIPIAWQGGNVTGDIALQVFNLSIDAGGQSGIDRSKEYTPVNASALENYLNQESINLRATFPGSLVGTGEYFDTVLVEKQGQLAFAMIDRRGWIRGYLGIEFLTSAFNGIQF